MSDNMTRWIYSAGFVLSVVGANVALSVFGVVPVGFGLVAPAGVYFAGITFGLRDAVQEAAGKKWTLALIAVGALLSAAIDPRFALASAAAFAISELADLAVYSPLRERHWIGAVVASNAVGSLVDSAVFLTIAFGSLDYIAGQVLGKLWTTVLALPLVYYARSRRRAFA